MATIRRQRGLFVAAAAVSLVLVSTTSVTTGILQVEANLLKTDHVSPASLRGGQQASLILPSVASRKLEDAQQEEENGNENQDDQQQEEENDDEQQEEEEQENQEEENDEQEEENDNHDDDGNGNDDAVSGQDIVNNAKETFQNVMDRFDEDVVNMWSTSPSEWDEEFWKVFGIVAGVVTVLLSCIIYICCLCCCGSSSDNSDKDFVVATQSEAEGRSRNRRGYRGRFIRRNDTGETDTVGGDDTSHTGITGNTTNDWESPFVLIEDVEKDDISDQGFKSDRTGDPSSPVYTRGNDVADFQALSPLSSKTNSMVPDDSTRAVSSPGNKTDKYSAASPHVPNVPTMSIDDNETQALKANSSVMKESSGGIINETVEVWSEFLGFKKSKYNIPPRAKTQDEDDEINLTDDEKTRRTSRSRLSSSSAKKRSSRKTVLAPSKTREVPLTRKSSGNAAAAAAGRSQMRTGTYTRPEEVAAGNEFSGESPSPAFPDDNVAETPIMSNSSINARLSKANSPRRTALIKTKNLLKSFGSNKTKVIKKSDPKEENLLSDNEIAADDV